jgi:hypothetical protein
MKFNLFSAMQQNIGPHPCLTDNRRPGAPPDALPVLRPMPRLEEEVSQSKIMTAVTIIFRNYNKYSLEHRAEADRPSRKRKPLYNATAYSLTKLSDQTSFSHFTEVFTKQIIILNSCNINNRHNYRGSRPSRFNIANGAARHWI